MYSNNSELMKTTRLKYVGQYIDDKGEEWSQVIIEGNLAIGRYEKSTTSIIAFVRVTEHELNYYVTSQKEIKSIELRFEMKSADGAVTNNFTPFILEGDMLMDFGGNKITYHVSVHDLYLTNYYLCGAADSPITPCLLQIASSNESQELLPAIRDGYYYLRFGGEDI